ncbi:SH3 domain-containing protein [Rhodalgimonas zhirmunskyi]|uniref:SH3 domain-containing protein n=1 Tax=Rhodalgimonas zhirmunskyi TaxID=2964767 RepID=A0AAJ1X5F9_9RHOB|nr:SH3 domain-containing protein [Rhodoalgimonas zhirmunskyi]MDQ2094491.1 SH3 domain-containing protein [Rhodoalgimonas zhirmunskyi]
MRFLASILLSLSLFLTAAHAETRIVNSPGDGFLNLRTGPGSGFEIVTHMSHGTTVEVLEVKGSWARVRHELTGKQGWAFRKYLVLESRGSAVREVWSPGDGYLNLRSGPGSDFQIMRRMYNGERVEILERKGNWVRVRHQSGVRGWAYSKYLRR